MLSLLRVKDSVDLWQIQGMTGIPKLGPDVSPTVDGSTLFTHLAGLENLVCLTLLSTNMVRETGQLKHDNDREHEFMLPDNFLPNLS